MKLFSFPKAALFAAIASAAVSLSLLAQTPAPPPSPSSPPGRPDRALPFRHPPNPLMEALDTNHDGILSADEIAGASASLKKLDRNGDGQLTEDELRPPSPGGRGGPPRGQPGTGDAGTNPGGFREESAERMPRPPGSPPFAGRDPSPADAAQHAPAAAIGSPRPPPRLEADPVAARLDDAGQGEAAQTPRPAAAPLTLFDLLDTNHDGTLSEEELRNAPAVLRQLDLKSIALPGASPARGGPLRPPPAP